MSNGSPLLRYLHDARRDEVRGRYYDAVLAERSLPVGQAAPEQAALWQAACDAVFDTAYDFHDPFVALTKRSLHEHRDQQATTQELRAIITAMVTTGLCRDYGQAGAIVQTLSVLTREVAQSIHATPEQRAQLKGVKPDPARQPRNFRGQFARKFRPEKAGSHFEQLRRSAEYDRPMHDGWGRYVSQQLDQRFWPDCKPYQSLTALGYGRGDIMACVFAVYGALIERHPDLPLMPLPSEQNFPFCARMEQNREAVTERLRGAGDLVPMMRMALLISANEAFDEAIRGQMEPHWRCAPKEYREQNAIRQGFLGEPPATLRGQRVQDPLGHAEAVFNRAAETLFPQEAGDFRRELAALRFEMQHSAFDYLRIRASQPGRSQ